MITITEHFWGYPDGKVAREFKPGDKPTDLPADFVDLIVKKGHAKTDVVRKDEPREPRK